MRELDIRLALRGHVLKEHGPDSETLVVEELGLCQGESRVDLAVINSSLVGYEIKCPQDTLERLPEQRRSYDLVFDKVVLVLSGEHVVSAEEMVPDWWGLMIAREANGQIGLSWKRSPSPNPGVDPHAVIQLIWRDEALAKLEELGLAKGARGARRQLLWERLVEALPLDELLEFVRAQIRSRADWRSDSIRA